MTTIRRVVTGHDANGRSVFTADEAVDATTFPMFPGFESFELWSEKGARFVPHGRGQPRIERYFPDEDEVIVRFAVFPAADYTAAPDVDMAAARDDVEQRYPGLVGHLESDTPGMHTTDSVDFGLVISGEIYLELDDGQERLLGPGACAVQNGTRHAWRNRSGKPVLMAFILAGAKRRS